MSTECPWSTSPRLPQLLPVWASSHAAPGGVVASPSVRPPWSVPALRFGGCPFGARSLVPFPPAGGLVVQAAAPFAASCLVPLQERPPWEATASGSTVGAVPPWGLRRPGGPVAAATFQSLQFSVRVPVCPPQLAVVELPQYEALTKLPKARWFASFFSTVAAETSGRRTEVGQALLKILLSFEAIWKMELPIRDMAPFATS